MNIGALTTPTTANSGRPGLPAGTTVRTSNGTAVAARQTAVTSSGDRRIGKRVQ